MTLATAREIATDRGVARRTVYGWIERYEDFPEPKQVIAGAKAWDLDEVRRWHAATVEQRREGRPRSA